MSDIERIQHRHWKHKALGYLVEVLDTRYSGCATVTVDRTRFSRVKRTWTVQKFLVEFEPIGAPAVPRSLWERL